MAKRKPTPAQLRQQLAQIENDIRAFPASRTSDRLLDALRAKERELREQLEAEAPGNRAS